MGLAEALLLLRERAYADSRPILEIARDVISGTLRFHLEGRDQPDAGYSRANSRLLREVATSVIDGSLTPQQLQAAGPSLTGR